MSVGLLNPAGALALAAIGVLIAFYLYGRRRRVVRVAALFLWEQVPARALHLQRLRPDPLFVAQLALLLALIGGLLRPYLEQPAPAGEGVRLLIVLDASASMQAREPGGTRFDLARRRARALVAQLLTGDEVMLVAAAERTHVVLRWTGDQARAQDRLEALEPLDTPTNLTPALELALGEVAARPETRVAVFTDLPREASGIAAERLALVDYVQIGRSDDNVAITGLTIAEPPFHTARQATATVLVRNYGRDYRRVVLEARVGEELWARRELSLAPRAVEHVLLTDPPAAGPLGVTLDAADALAVDDRAFARVADDEVLDLLVATASPEHAAAFAELGRTVAGGRVRAVEPDRWAGEAARVAVFDGFVPPDPPAAVPTLYLDPPPGNPVCPSEHAIADAAVIDWDADHPALHGLEGLEALTLTHARTLATPAWGTAIVLAATERKTFPLLVAGEKDGRRVACLGTGPLASSDALPLVVLTLGTLRWLSAAPESGVLAVRTGVPVLFGDGLSEIHDAALRVAGDPPVLVAERTGIYHVGGRTVTANLFDERESDIGRSGGGEWPSTRPIVTASTSGGRRELAWWLYLVATAWLAVEWLVWHRRANVREAA